MNSQMSVNFLVSLLKKNWQNVGALYLKSSMGKPQRRVSSPCPREVVDLSGGAILGRWHNSRAGRAACHGLAVVCSERRHLLQETAKSIGTPSPNCMDLVWTAEVVQSEQGALPKTGATGGEGRGSAGHLGDHRPGGVSDSDAVQAGPAALRRRRHLALVEPLPEADALQAPQRTSQAVLLPTASPRSGAGGVVEGSFLIPGSPQHWPPVRLANESNSSVEWSGGLTLRALLLLIHRLALSNV